VRVYNAILAGVMAVWQIAERSLAEAEREISLVLDAVEVVLMGTSPSPFSRKWTDLSAITVQLNCPNRTRQSLLQSLLVQFPRERNVQPL
jgi:hypothetical protein